jgi:peptidoglycan/LPS O-acetylase OafA/YrhL
MRIEQLTFTRFIAAISIVIFHYGMDTGLFNNSFIAFIFQQGNIGVSYFFILSGFVMVIAYHNKLEINFIGYLKNRFARIYPVYLLALIVVLFLKIFSGNIDFLDLFLNIFMIQAWIPGKALSFNYTGWSLSVEFLFYFMFPFLYNKIYRKTSYRNLVLPVVLFWLLSQVVFNMLDIGSFFKQEVFIQIDLSYFPPMHINEFLIGNLAGLYFVSKANKKQRNFDGHIITLTLIVVVLLKFPIGLNYHNGLLAVLFIPLIILTSLNNGILTVFFSSKICVFLGEISFGIYILQYPVWCIMNDNRLTKYFLIDKEDFTSAFFIRFIALLLFSGISYVYFEKPIREKIKSFKLAKMIRETNLNVS